MWGNNWDRVVINQNASKDPAIALKSLEIEESVSAPMDLRSVIAHDGTSKKIRRNLIRSLSKCSIPFKDPFQASARVEPKKKELLRPFLIIDPAAGMGALPSLLKLESLSIEIETLGDIKSLEPVKILGFILDDSYIEHLKNAYIPIMKLPIPPNFSKPDFDKGKAYWENMRSRKTCFYCNEEFDSRTKLFEHVTAKKHNVELTDLYPQMYFEFNLTDHGTAKTEVKFTKLETNSHKDFKFIILRVITPSPFKITSIKSTIFKSDIPGINYSIFSGSKTDRNEEKIYSLRKGVTQEHFLQMKQVGIKFLLELAKASDGDINFLSSILNQPLQSLCEVLSSHPPLFMFNDWSPPRKLPITPLKLRSEFAYATATDSFTYNPSNAVLDSGYWKSVELKDKGGSRSVTWGITFEKPESVVAIQVIFEETHWPDQMTVLVNTSHSKNGQVVLTRKESEFSSEGVLYLTSPPLWSKGLSLLLSGKGSKNPDAFIAIREVRIFKTLPEGGIYHQPCDVLMELTYWLRSLALNKGNDMSEAVSVLSPIALNTLRTLSLSTGGLNSLLHLILVLLKLRGNDSNDSIANVDDDNTKYASKIQNQLIKTIAKERIDLLRKEDSSSKSWPLKVELKSAAFDQTMCTTGIVLSNHGRVANYAIAESTATIHAHAMLNVGFAHGQATWVWKLDEDTSSQTTCFGLAIKPVIDSAYDHSKQLWMYRAYNGHLYARGEMLSSKFRKVVKGDLVKCDLDMDEGTMSYTINGEYQGIAFTDLRGLEVYPAVSFYGEKRAVSLSSITATRRVCHYLYTITEIGSFVRKGTNVGKGSHLGYEGENGTTYMVIQQKPVQHGLSMCPPAGGDAYLKYDLDSMYESLRVSVALNDDIMIPDTENNTTTVIFEVWGDGTLLWSSKPIKNKGVLESHDIDLLDVSELILKVCDRSTDKNVKYAHGVWSVAAVEMQSPYRKWYRNVYSSGINHDIAEAGNVLSSEDSKSKAISNLTSAREILDSLSKYCATRMIPHRKPGIIPTKTGTISNISLEAPFAIQVCSDTFVIIKDILEYILQLELTSDDSSKMIEDLLQISLVNIRRLIVSNIHPNVVGLDVKSSKEGNMNIMTEYCNLLRRMYLDSSTCDSLKDMISEVLYHGLSLFVPQKSVRYDLIVDVLPSVKVIEMQFRWPGLTHLGIEHSHLESVVLLVQVACKKLMCKCKVVGKWMNFLYLVFELPEISSKMPESTSKFAIQKIIEEIVVKSFKSAGFKDFSFPFGLVTPLIPLKIEQTPNWNREKRLPYEQGVGIIRLYTKAGDNINLFDTVCNTIKRRIDVTKNSK